MADIWLTAGMSDVSAFHLTLANAALLFGKETGSKEVETTEAMKYYTTSLQSLSNRLHDPVDGISEGVITTVLGFVCHDVGSPIGI
jgi:hypothetical protein